MSGFTDFDAYLGHARVTALTASPDGLRVIATVAQLNDDGDTFVTALWELDPAGIDEPRRLTRSAKGESNAVIAADGSVLFTSAREGKDDDPAALWRLPRTGEASKVREFDGGISTVAVAGAADTVVVASGVLPGSGSLEEDTERRTARKKAKTTALLHSASPVRYWDHDLGPDELRLFALDGDRARELTPAPGRALDEAGTAVSADGSTVITTWQRPVVPGFPHAALVAIDTADGTRRVLAEGPDISFSSPAVSHDGRFVVAVKSLDCTEDSPWSHTLWLQDLVTGRGHDVLADLDVWPTSPVFGADSGTVFFLADQQGQAPVFRLDVPTGTVSRVTASGHYTNLTVTADGQAVFALRDAWDSPPRPARLDATATDGEPTYLPCPGEIGPLPGTLERIGVTAVDGTEIGAWLVLPDGASAEAAAPLLLFMHGGPFSSWNGWTWRWNPWLMAARGYAVLLPDPALSTGYGVQMLRRGWGQWGGAPYTDLMSVMDAVVARPDIDQTRTAAMGGSYGGYLANWVAGHTDRFRCIVTHASLWAMDQFQGTTDMPGDWALEWGLPQSQPDRYAEFSPHRYAEQIRTPMLVIHGDKDYRVPIGEGLRLWWDLQRLGVESKFLYFADEGHWILKPGNARVWYETVWAWLDQHLRDQPWRQPELL